MSPENGLHSTTATDGDFIFSLLSFLLSHSPTYICIYICFTLMIVQEVRTYVCMYVYTQLNHRLRYVPMYAV